jgi:hypothetical protein
MLQETCGGNIQVEESRRTIIRWLLQDAATMPTKNLWKDGSVSKGHKKRYHPEQAMLPISFPSRAERTSIVRYLASSSVCPNGLANRRGRRGQAGGGLGGGENSSFNGHWLDRRDVRAMLVALWAD